MIAKWHTDGCGLLVSVIHQQRARVACGLCHRSHVICTMTSLTLTYLIFPSRHKTRLQLQNLRLSSAWFRFSQTAKLLWIPQGLLQERLSSGQSGHTKQYIKPSCTNMLWVHALRTNATNCGKSFHQVTSGWPTVKIRRMSTTCVLVLFIMG